MNRNAESLNAIFNASYNRMKSYMYDHETVTLTADKSQRNKPDYKGEHTYGNPKLEVFTNVELEVALRDSLRELCDEHGWKVIPVYGGYQGVNDKSPDNEHSYMVINMTDEKNFRQTMNDFMREFDESFDIDFKQESIMYSPALGKESEDNGNAQRTFDEQGEWDYPSTGEDSVKLGKFRDKSKGISRDDKGYVEGYFYTKPRRYKSHSFAFGDDFTND